MHTENNRQTLVQDLYDNIDFRYPLTSGSTQYDFNSGNVKTVFRGKEPVQMVYPAMRVEFLPKSQNMGDSIDHVYGMFSGHLVFAMGELEPVVITVYTHQQSMGQTRGWHGKIIGDAYIRRVEKHIRRSWPALLRTMESSIKTSFPFTVYDISNFQEGTERNGFELTFHIVTTNKWDLLIDESNTGVDAWEDAVVSGLDHLSYDAGEDYQKYHTISGYT